MKLSVTETYDVSQIAQTNTYSEIQTFIDYQLDVSNDIITSYYNGLTITENIKSSIYSLDVQHGTTTIIPLNSSYTISSINSIVPVRCYSLSRTATNTVNLTVWFDQPVTVRTDQALWQSGNITRYRCTNSIQILKLGDFVTFTGMGTANNNGTFQVVDIDTVSNYIYVINRKRINATGDETRTGYAGVENVKTSIQITFIV